MRIDRTDNAATTARGSGGWGVGATHAALGVVRTRKEHQPVCAAGCNSAMFDNMVILLCLHFFAPVLRLELRTACFLASLPRSSAISAACVVSPRELCGPCHSVHRTVPCIRCCRHFLCGGCIDRGWHGWRVGRASAF